MFVVFENFWSYYIKLAGIVDLNLTKLRLEICMQQRSFISVTNLKYYFKIIILVFLFVFCTRKIAKFSFVIHFVKELQFHRLSRVIVRLLNNPRVRVVRTFSSFISIRPLWITSEISDNFIKFYLDQLEHSLECKFFS